MDDKFRKKANYSRSFHNRSLDYPTSQELFLNNVFSRSCEAIIPSELLRRVGEMIADTDEKPVSLFLPGPRTFWAVRAYAWHLTDSFGLGPIIRIDLGAPSIFGSLQPVRNCNKFCSAKSLLVPMKGSILAGLEATANPDGHASQCARLSPKRRPAV